MRGRRGTLQPVREGRKSPTLFAPSRSPIDAIAPTATSVSIAESSITSTGRNMMEVVDMDIPRMDHNYGGSSSEDSSPTTTSTSSSPAPAPPPAPGELAQKSLLYSLQDENADLRKAIQGLEIVLRDHGFARDGKQIIPTDEIVRIEHDNDVEGNQRTHMEMVSMMGMDPERTTVLTRYMEFKVSDLQDDLEKMESDRDRLATLVRTLTTEASAKESLRAGNLRQSKAQKRKLEERLTNAIKVSKTRETFLSNKVGGLESNLEASQAQEGLLLKRISELETELESRKGGSSNQLKEDLLSKKVQKLESRIDTFGKKEGLLKQQITALETNLEWNIEESTKREKLLRGQITALETNLEWSIDQSTRREDLLRDKISELETSNDEDEDEDEDEEDEDEDETLTKEDDSFTKLDDSFNQNDLLVRPGDYLQPLKNTASPDEASPHHAFQQSISELSKQHNQQLEEWKRQESKERVEQLKTQINALETNLEWNIKESKNVEDLLRNQLTALETNLEWNIEEATKREALLQDRIKELEAKKYKEEEDSLTVDPVDFLEQQKQLEYIKQKKEKLEEWLSKVVEESTKREENLQQVITGLEIASKASVGREEALKARTTELETRVGELQTERARQGDLEKVLEAALEKELRKQELLVKEVAMRRNTVQAKDMHHEEQLGNLISKIAELESRLLSSTKALEREEQKNKNLAANANTKSASPEEEPDHLVSSNDPKHREIASLSGRIVELENELEFYRKEKFERNKRITKLQSDIEAIAQKNEGLSETVMVLESELDGESHDAASAREENGRLSEHIEELEEELKKERKEKVYRNETIADLQTDLDKAMRKNGGISTRIFELENELESYRKEKFDRNKRVAKLQSDIEAIAQKNEGLSETVMELESELEYERQEKSSRRRSIVKLQSDLANATIQQAPISALNDHLEKQAEANESERKSLAKRLADLQIEFDTNSKFFESMKAYNRSLEIELESVKTEQERYHKRIEELTAQLKEEEESKADDTAKEAEFSIHESLQSELASAKKEQERLHGCIADLLRKLEESNSSSNTEQERLNRRIEELSNKLVESNSSSIAKQGRLNKRIEELSNELEESKSSSNAEQERLKKRIKNLSNKLEESNDKITNDEERQQTPAIFVIPEIENEPEPERTEVEGQRTKVLKKVRNKVIAELKNELENRQRIVELSDLRKEFVDNAIQHKAREEELSSRMLALETEVEFGQHEQERLERVIVVLRNELKMAAEIHEPVVTRNREIEKQLESQKVEKGNLRKEVDDLKSQLEDTNNTFHNRVLELKMKLKSKQSEFEHLNEFKHELEAELEETTEKVQKIEAEFENAAKTMDATYKEVSVRNTKIEKELNSFKIENQYLNKFVRELQDELADKHNIKREAAHSLPNSNVIKKMDSIKEFSERSEHDELIESTRLIESERLNESKLSIDEDFRLSVDEDSEEELQMSGKTKDDFESSSSSSSAPSSSVSRKSGEDERKRLTSEIAKIEKELESEKSKLGSLKKTIADLEDEKSRINDESKDGNSSKSTKTLTAQIRVYEAELEALTAQIYELEADLEDLLDEIWDCDQDGELDMEEHELDLDDRVGKFSDGFNVIQNREHLAGRILELEKEMEELEDELEDTIEQNKSERQTLIRKNVEMEKLLEVTIEKAKKEQHALAIRNNELEKELVMTIENGRKDQQTLAIHYIEIERELKQATAKANAEEKRLKSQISKLEKDIESIRTTVNREDDFLSTRLAILMNTTERDNDGENDDDAVSEYVDEDNSSKEHVVSREAQPQLTPKSHRKEQERLVAKVSELKKEFDSTVKENQVLNETVVEVETKLRLAQETIERAEKDVEDLNEKYVQLETQWKISDDDHDTAIWEAEQKMRDLIETASLERRNKKKIERECKIVKQDFEEVQYENKSLSSENKRLAMALLEKKAESETLFLRVAELTENYRSVSKTSNSEHERITQSVENLREELETCERKNKDLSSQLQSYEEAKKGHAILYDRFTELEKEHQSVTENREIEQQLHAELKARLVEITMKNQAERANLENRLRKLQKDLESTTRKLESFREENKSLAADLKIFEPQKNALNTSDINLEDDLRTAFEENENIFRQIQSYQIVADEKDTGAPLTPGSNDRTATTNSYADEDTLNSDNDDSPNGFMSEEDRGQGEADSRANDSTHNSISTAKATNGGLRSIPLLVENNEANSSTIPVELQNQAIEDYLTPLVEKVDKVLGQEIPNAVVRGIREGLLLRAEEALDENFLWEDFESILEEVCQEYDQDTWFDIQEAFFVAWEEIEIEKMGGDLSGQEDDSEVYDQ